jgi:hypothetical protein
MRAHCGASAYKRRHQTTVPVECEQRDGERERPAWLSFDHAALQVSEHFELLALVRHVLVGERDGQVKMSEVVAQLADDVRVVALVAPDESDCESEPSLRWSEPPDEDRVYRELSSDSGGATGLF